MADAQIKLARLSEATGVDGEVLRDLVRKDKSLGAQRK